jgi:alkylated DNA repair dioxygenase AlkB
MLRGAHGDTTLSRKHRAHFRVKPRVLEHSWSTRMPQLSLFASPSALPEGFAYQDDFLSPAEEQTLVRWFPELPFREFEFRGYRGKRRVVSFGWRYDFNTGQFVEAGDLPPDLVLVRDRAAAFVGLAPGQLHHVLLTEYPAGAAIGWHKDRPEFGEVVGISLLAESQFRLRRQAGSKWERWSITAEPRSIYLLRGPSRTEWEHSIPAVASLRYSITFRSVRALARTKTHEP